MRQKMKSAGQMQADTTGTDTRERLLNAAERLFAQKGFNGVSTRMITEVADANNAAMHYHFGSKEAVIRAVFERRLGRINGEREHLMTLALAETPPDPAKILTAFLGPPLALGSDEGEQHFRVLAAQASMDPSPEVRRTVFDFYDAVGRRFIEALRVACPQLSREELFWRAACIYGAMLYIRADNGRLQQVMGDDLSMSDPTEALAHMIPFLTAGLTAPPTAVPRPLQSNEVTKVPNTKKSKPGRKPKVVSDAV